MSDVNVAVNIEARLDSTDVIRETLIDTIMTAGETPAELVKNKDLMVALTTLLRDRDGTNTKRLRISADKEMAKKSGEEAMEIMRMVMDRQQALKIARETNPDEHAAKRRLDRSELPEVEVTEELVKVGTSDLSYDKFMKGYEEERGISGRT